MAVAPFRGWCDSEECDRDDPKMLVWQPVKPGNNYARCFSCGTIRYVERTYEAQEDNPYPRDDAVAASEGDGS